MTSGTNNSFSLNIYSRDLLVGSVTFSHLEKPVLEYSQEWLAEGFPLSPTLPLSGAFETNAIEIFLQNLFPEGESLDLLLSSQRISRSNIAAIIKAIGHDTAGALVFAQNKPDPSKSILRQIKKSELVERLNTAKASELIFWDGKYRLSVAGVQNKLNVMIDHSGDYFLADGVLSSTHILKFPIPHSPLIAVNEFFCMRLAKAVGLNVADVRLEKVGPHYMLVVRRFDRLFKDQLVKKAHTVDGCQVLNLPPSYKYEHNFGSSKDVAHIRNGANLNDLITFIKKYDISGLVDLFEWIIFNVIVGNSDAHGKNLSFVVTRNTYRLAPFYDIISVVHEAKQNTDLDTELAMAIGDNFDINSITAYNFLDLCEQNNIGLSFIKNRLGLIVRKIQKTIKNNKLDLDGHESNNEVSFIFDQLTDLILSRCEKMFKQYEEFDAVKDSLFP
ncbi:MAG: HipA domain-containing protein [Marinicella sp.]